MIVDLDVEASSGIPEIGVHYLPVVQHQRKLRFEMHADGGQCTPQLDLRMGIGGSSPRRPRRQHGSEHGGAGATTAAEKGGDVVQRRHVELRPPQTLFNDAFQIRLVEVFGQVEDSPGGAGQADAVVTVVDVFWWHDRASMMHGTQHCLRGQPICHCRCCNIVAVDASSVFGATKLAMAAVGATICRGIHAA